MLCVVSARLTSVVGSVKSVSGSGTFWTQFAPLLMTGGVSDTTM